jgi:hypothetical protein
METHSLQLDKASPKADVTVMATHSFSKHVAERAFWDSASLHEIAARSCLVNPVV